MPRKVADTRHRLGEGRGALRRHAEVPPPACGHRVAGVDRKKDLGAAGGRDLDAASDADQSAEELRLPVAPAGLYECSGKHEPVSHFTMGSMDTKGIRGILVRGIPLQWGGAEGDSPPT